MPRRGDNIRKRKDGRWEARYLMPVDATGDRRYGSVYGRSYQEAKEKRDMVLTHPQVVQASTQLRVKDLLYAWQDSNRIRLKESSVSRYQNLIDTHILPDIGSLNVGMLTTPYLNKFIGTKLRNGRVDGKGGLSPSYVRSIALVIDAAIKYGASEQLCMPLKSPLTKPSLTKKEVVVLSKETQTKLENNLLTKMTAEKLLTYITLYTGLRIGEALALMWEDIDLSKQVLYVRHTISRVWQVVDGKKHSVWIVEEPKTQASKRVIPLCSKLIQILKDYPYRKASGYLLTTNGNFISPRTFEYRYKRILTCSGLTPVNFHSLRHTFATRCVEANVDIKSLSEILGHADASITLNTYVHSSIELKRCQLEKIV